ncbi:MAG: hypothetical protein AABZ31_00370 [Bdellovibrionota bacterium]
MSKVTYSFILLSVSFFMGCSDLGVSGIASDDSRGGLGGVCDLTGTWSRCSSYGGSSTRVVIIGTDTSIHETIESFNTADNCVGAPDSTVAFNATYVLGVQGAAASVAGATDADLVPDVDLFGCGAHQPAYTFVKFNTSCTEFNPAISVPSCDINSRGTSLDSEPFIKQ